MDFNVEVKDGKTVRLPTAEKYCDYDIVVTATGGGSDLAKQIIDRTVENITDSSIETIGPYAFAYCTSLTEASLPNCVNAGTSAFDHATALITADFPRLKKVNNNVFAACTSLKSLNLPECEQLTSNSVRDCSALEKIDLPKTEIINTNVFLNCSMLSAVILRANTMAALSSGNSFNNTPIASGTGYIYVPATLKSQYEQATNWSVFQFRAIEDYPEITGG